VHLPHLSVLKSAEKNPAGVLSLIYFPTKLVVGNLGANRSETSRLVGVKSSKRLLAHHLRAPPSTI